MTGFIILTLCLLASTISALPRRAEENVETTEPNEVPGDDIVCEEGVEFIPHQDCRKYYQCVHFNPIVQNCPATLFWNPRKNECDDPREVPECVGGTRPPPNTPAPTQAPTDAPTQAPTQAPTDAPTQAPTDAPTQAPTDAPTQAPTDAPTEAPTDAPTQAPTDAPTQAPTDAPTTPTPGVCRPGEIHNVPVPGNCSAYILCIHGQGYPQVCADGLLFDPVLLKCNLAEEVTCATEPPTPAPPTTTPLPPTPQPICEDPTGVYNVPFPGNCSLFYLCALGTPVLQTCANRLLFDVNQLKCVPEAEAQCYVEPTPPVPTTEPTTTTTTLATTTTRAPLVCRPGEVYNVEFYGDCSKYILCANGVPILQNCASGTIFNPAPDVSKCVLESDYDCPYDPSHPPTQEPEPEPTTSAPEPETTADPFPCPDVDHVFVAHPTNCKAFYACRRGQFSGVFYCGTDPDLWFDTLSQGCREPWNSDCRGGIGTTLAQEN